MPRGRLSWGRGHFDEPARAHDFAAGWSDAENDWPDLTKSLPEQFRVPLGVELSSEEEPSWVPNGEDVPKRVESVSSEFEEGDCDLLF